MHTCLLSRSCLQTLTHVRRVHVAHCDSSAAGCERTRGHSSSWCHCHERCCRGICVVSKPNWFFFQCVLGLTQVDIYGHANSTLVNGSRMLNGINWTVVKAKPIFSCSSCMSGIGGSGDFLRNSYMNIIHIPSARKTATGWISSIVPMVYICDRVLEYVNQSIHMLSRRSRMSTTPSTMSALS